MLRVAHDEQPTGLERELEPRPALDVGRIGRDEHCDLDLERIGVLELVEQQHRVAIVELRPHRCIAAQEIAREREQIMKLDAAFRPTLASTLARELGQRVDHLPECRLAYRVDRVDARVLGPAEQLQDLVLHAVGPVFFAARPGAERRPVGKHVELLELVACVAETVGSRLKLAQMPQETVVVIAAAVGEGRRGVEERDDRPRVEGRNRDGSGGADLIVERLVEPVDVAMEHARQPLERRGPHAESEQHDERPFPRRVVEERIQEARPALSKSD